MRYTPYILLLFVLLQSCEPKPSALEKYGRTQMLSGIYTHAIAPMHQQLIDEATTLDSVAKIFAATPTADNLVALQNEWKATQAIWQVCEPVNVGDVRESFIHNSINKWPANTNFIENYIDGPTELNEAFIESIGSTSKGLTAMEYLIFGTDNNTILQLLTTGTNATRRVQYVTALAANLKSKTKELQYLWANYESAFISQTGLAIDGSANLLVNAIIEYEEFIKNDKVGAPLGKKTGGTVQPSSVENGLSKTSLQHIIHNLEGIDAMLKGSITSANKAGLYAYLDAVDPMEGGEKLSDKIKTQMTACKNATTAINTPLQEAVVNNPAQVDALYLELKKLTVLLKVDMTSILGVTVTFTDNDGD